MPSIVVPFSALDGAGIDIDSVRILDVEPDSEWTETIERRTLAELPRWRQTYSESVTRTADMIVGVPQAYRRTWRQLTEDELASGAYPYAHNGTAYADLLPDADGLYRWTEGVRRPTKPDDDGLYRYTETRHRLGASLFTAERTILEPPRPAHPLESNVQTRRYQLELRATDSRGYCRDAPSYQHEAGPSGECVTCGQPLTAHVSYARRARYLSAFDYNEPAPLYFLCEVPRAGLPTVQGALDSLAPRAVHAAILQGREVRRQGDIFFIDTDLTSDVLASRGAVFGRLTQWTRDAKPRAGEITYRAPNPIADRARAKRELAYARKVWRDEWHALQLRAVDAGPMTSAKSRRRWSDIRARHAAEVAAARAQLRRATLAGPRYRNGYPIGVSGRAHYETQADYRRRAHRDAVRIARQRLNTLLATGPRDSNGNTSRAHGRDNYRARYGQNALALWSRAQLAAQRKYRPWTVTDAAVARANRERIRRHLAIYGTAHSASEVARVGSSVYVRGTVRHVIDLEPGRRGGPDHRPLVLTADRWYLAVRNTVPRQNRRRRRLSQQPRV